jgi:L-asparaginase/Glu-tRNA(Gln) amidotransferase subunit D
MTDKATLTLVHDLLKDDYDALVIAGGMGEGHIPVNAIDEMIRVVKPGMLYHVIFDLLPISNL